MYCQEMRILCVSGENQGMNPMNKVLILYLILIQLLFQLRQRPLSQEKSKIFMALICMSMAKIVFVVPAW